MKHKNHVSTSINKLNPGFILTSFMLLFIFSLKANAQVELNLNLYIEGFYTGGGLMDNYGTGGRMFVCGQSANPSDADRVFIAAVDPSDPQNVIDEQTGILQTDGNVSVTFSLSVSSGNSYYLRIRHCGTVETWSAAPVFFSPVTTYSFSSAASQAFGDNQILLPPDNIYYGIYSGDINQDGTVDGLDWPILDCDIQAGAGCNDCDDLNGDGAVDATDFLIFEPNVRLGAGVLHP